MLKALSILCSFAALPLILGGIVLDREILFWAGIGCAPAYAIVWSIMFAHDLRQIRELDMREEGLEPEFCQVWGCRLREPRAKLVRLSIYDDFVVVKYASTILIPIEKISGVEIQKNMFEQVLAISHDVPEWGPLHLATARADEAKRVIEGRLPERRNREGE
jgi:hypothetical protein